MKNINRQLGERLRHLRQERGFTQEGLAEACGVHRAHLGEIERGEVDVTVTTLQRISYGLEISVSSLLRGVGADKKRYSA